jgi:hypothetical protein
MGLGQATIGKGIGSSNDDYRLFHTFRSRKGTHKAWGQMIRPVKGVAGVYRLAKPESPKNPRLRTDRALSAHGGESQN